MINDVEHKRFRQIHLDFHTAGDLPGVGSQFNADEFTRTLTDAAVDSITLFAVCHHGYCYYPTKVGTMHPTLDFDLLGEQLKAAHKAGVRTQIYISAGANEVAAVQHPEWREVKAPDGWTWSCLGVLQPGFHEVCFNTGYMDYLLDITKEVLERYPDNDCLFFDIVMQNQCCCPKCLRDMFAAGFDPCKKEDRLAFCDQVMRRYYHRIDELVKSVNPKMGVFHNTGDICTHFPDIVPLYDHLELESLPTGGWGYDHFPLSAALARKFSHDYVGMTGKFHGTWGEFGGIKHPNALRYECAAMLAQGACCNVGDQLHPNGKFDATTYRVIGEAFQEVREKEAYCRYAVNRAEIAVISAAGCKLDGLSDIGVSRLLLESHFLFDVLLESMDFSEYALVIFPEGYKMDEAMQKRVEAYLAKGGQVLFAGDCIADLPLAVPWKVSGKNELNPTYILPGKAYCPEFVSTPFVMYGANTFIACDQADSLGEVYEPYYNRTLEHFTSHQHTPPKPEASSYALGATHGGVTALAYNFFTIYSKNGAVVLREFFEKLIASLLGGKRLVESDLPSVARTTLTMDEKNRREILHLLYAPLVKRGEKVEVIEDLMPLGPVHCKVRTAKPVASVKLVPENKEIPFVCEGDAVKFEAPAFTCHAMIELKYGK